MGYGYRDIVYFFLKIKAAFPGSRDEPNFRYEVQDHFGLDIKDIDHNSFDDNPDNDGKPL